MVDDKSVEPGKEARTAVKTSCLAEELDKYLLTEILCIVVVPSVSITDRIDPLTISGKDLLKSRF